MGKATKALKAFIEDIPDAKLTGFPTVGGTIYRTTEFRLDMQGMTVNNQFNLQIQANKEAKITSVKGLAPKTVAGPVFIGRNETVTAAQIREKFMDKMLI